MKGTSFIRIIKLILFFVVFLEFSIAQESIYQFKVKDINGNIFDFAMLKGKKILIVNTASKCGYTSQYEDMERLYQRYKKSGLVVIGFPANNFRNQEPGTNKEISEFCSDKYNITFPMMAKISVKGDDTHPLYHFLTNGSRNGFKDSEVHWNFQKYLVNENGHLVGFYLPSISPVSSEIIDLVSRK